MIPSQQGLVLFIGGCLGALSSCLGILGSLDKQPVESDGSMFRPGSVVLAKLGKHVVFFIIKLRTNSFPGHAKH